MAAQLVVRPGAAPPRLPPPPRPDIAGQVRELGLNLRRKARAALEDRERRR
jgi:hypothetical protein